VFNKIMSLNDGKVPGNNVIIPESLKRVACEISKPLAILNNKSVTEGVVPQEWKRANITSLFTKSFRSEPGNYRPVNLMSYLGKVLDWVRMTFCII